jgi:hypothetical protein
MPKPASYRVSTGCSKACTLNEFNLPPGSFPEIHAMYEAGLPQEAIQAKVKETWQHHLSFGAIQRHRSKHLEKVTSGFAPSPNAPTVGATGKKVSDLDLLDLMITKGADVLNAPNVKISPEQLLRAMELRLKLTQGSVFQDFFDAIGAVSGEVAETNAEAVASEEEQAQGDGG